MPQRRPFDHGADDQVSQLHRNAVAARMDGKCSCCEKEYSRGAYIIPDGEGGWRLLSCAEDEE
jgi:hypothetical protein